VEAQKARGAESARIARAVTAGRDRAQAVFSDALLAVEALRQRRAIAEQHLKSLGVSVHGSNGTIKWGSNISSISPGVPVYVPTSTYSYGYKATGWRQPLQEWKISLGEKLQPTIADLIAIVPLDGKPEFSGLNTRLSFDEFAREGLVRVTRGGDRSSESTTWELDAGQVLESFVDEAARIVAFYDTYRP
jgi:hypothetical protein